MSARAVDDVRRLLHTMIALALVAPGAGYCAASVVGKVHPATAPAARNAKTASGSRPTSKAHGAASAGAAFTSRSRPTPPAARPAAPSPVGGARGSGAGHFVSAPARPAAAGMAGSVQGKRAPVPTTLGGPAKYDAKRGGAIGGTLMRPKPR